MKRWMRALGAALCLFAGTGCYTYTCNDACVVEIDCLGNEMEPQACAEACVQRKDVETPEQHEGRLQCWDCYQQQSCDAVRTGACSALCTTG